MDHLTVGMDLPLKGFSPALAAWVGAVLVLAYRVDELPEQLRGGLQKWLRGNHEHERAAPTSKLIAYHLEIWFSNNR